MSKLSEKKLHHKVVHLNMAERRSDRMFQRQQANQQHGACKIIIIFFDEQQNILNGFIFQ